MPAVQALYERKLQDLGVQIVGVTQFDTTFDQAQGFIDDSGLAFENIFDSEAGIAAIQNLMKSDTPRLAEHSPDPLDASPTTAGIAGLTQYPRPDTGKLKPGQLLRFRAAL